MKCSPKVVNGDIGLVEETKIEVVRDVLVRVVFH